MCGQMNNTIAIILSYCNTEYKINVLSENLLHLKDKSIDICLISPIPLKPSIQNLCNYFIYTRENPVFKWPERYYSYWVKLIDGDGNQFVMKYMDMDYYWTVLYQLKTSFNLVKNMEYDTIIIMNYDLDMKNNPLSYINGDGNVMFNTKYDENDTSISPLLLSHWKLDDLSHILSCITKDDWVVYAGLAEDYVKSKVELLNIEFSVPDLIINDLITYYATSKKMETWTDIDNHTYGFKMYITNIYIFSIWLYEFDRTLENLEIEIILKNRNSVKYNICEFKDTMLRTPYRCDDINSIYVNVDGCILDLTSILTNDAKQIIEYV
jgi:hypothetical protein